MQGILLSYMSRKKSQGKCREFLLFDMIQGKCREFLLSDMIQGKCREFLLSDMTRNHILYDYERKWCNFFFQFCHPIDCALSVEEQDIHDMPLSFHAFKEMTCKINF